MAPAIRMVNKRYAPRTRERMRSFWLPRSSLWANWESYPVDDVLHVLECQGFCISFLLPDNKWSYINSCKHIHLLAHRSSSKNSGQAWLGSSLLVSEGKIKWVSRLSSGGSGGRIAFQSHSSKCWQNPVLKAVVLMFLFPWWLSSGGSFQLLEIINILAYVAAFSIFKSPMMIDVFLLLWISLSFPLALSQRKLF